MTIPRSHVGAAFLVGAFILTACSGGGGSASLPASVAPSVSTSSIAAPQSLHHKHRRHPRDASVCTTVPVNGLQVTTTSMTLAPNGSGQFTACTQYASKYKITASPSGILTAPTSPSSVTPKVQPTTIKTATITVTAGATACQDATITVKDKKGKTQTVSVHVTGCSQTFTFTAPGGAQAFPVPTGVTQITVDAVGAGGGKGCLNGQYTSAGGLGYELKASGIAVTPGQTLYVYVGGSPVANTTTLCSQLGLPVVATYEGSGFNGGGTGAVFPGLESLGGGGGASDVRTTSNDLTTRMIVAGGGGGGAGVNGAAGGPGGYPNGAAGGYFFVGTDPTSSLAGQGGTQNAGGAGGQIPGFQNIIETCSGNQGSLGLGGSDTACAAAGGGGYYGGGSGAGYATTDYTGDQGVGAGGGGSSFAPSGATIITQQVATPGQCDANNNGCITILY